MEATEESPKVTKTKRIIETYFKQLLDRKSIQRISVNEICKISMISRSTFYLHFQDKYALLKYCLEEELKRWNTALNEKPIEDFIDFAINSVSAERNFYYNAFFCEPTNELLNIARDAYFRMFLSRLTEKQAAGVDVPQPITIVAAFYSGAALSSIVQWLYEDFSLSKEELAECQRALMPSWML